MAQRCGFVGAKYQLFYRFLNIRSVVVVWLLHLFLNVFLYTPAIKTKSSPGTFALTSFCVYQRVGRDGTKRAYKENTRYSFHAIKSERKYEMYCVMQSANLSGIEYKPRVCKHDA